MSLQQSTSDNIHNHVISFKQICFREKIISSQQTNPSGVLHKPNAKLLFIWFFAILKKQKQGAAEKLIPSSYEANPPCYLNFEYQTLS